VDHYPEEEKKNGRLYNRDVFNLIFRYLLAYKKYLFTALLLVLFITGANLAVPFLFKTIIDRFVFKQGKVLDTRSLSGLEKREFIHKQLKKAVLLDDSHGFISQANLKYFSEQELKTFIAKGVLSKNNYVLIQPIDIDRTIGRKIEEMVRLGDALVFPGSRYLFKPSALSEFTVQEVVALRARDIRGIVRFILLIVAILLVQFTSSYFQILLLMRLSQQAMRDLRRDLFAHILSLEVSYFEKNPIGKLVNRVTNDIERLNELFSSVLITFFQDILMMAGIAVVMYMTSIQLALIVSITFPFLVLCTILFRIQVRNAYRVIRTKISDLNSFLNETITGIRIVQIFVRESKNFKKFLGINTDVYSAQLRQLYVNAVFRPIIGFMRWFAIAAVIYFGARGIVESRISFGLLVMFIAYIERFFHPVQDLSEKFDIMQSATAAGEKILSVLQADAVKETAEQPKQAGKMLHVGTAYKKNPASGLVLTSVDDPPVETPFRIAPKLGRFNGRIEFKNVWFAYNADEWVLRDISFSVEPMQTLAIVGETGAGKTTIISLLSRFYRAKRGSILIDGVDIERIPHSELRRNIIPVMQDVFLFSRSVRENITLGNMYDADRFAMVSQATHTDYFIQRLPEREQQPVMERGVTFSAGERQLLSFARALYFDPSVLVLDEATSSIDTETERLIQDALARLTEGRTSIIIAHRLSTIQHAHKIVVLEKGIVVEEGTHATLLSKKGLYHRLYTLQFGGSLSEHE
jgi:ATP-binding cassette subfamily B multidrug efflux pump